MASQPLSIAELAAGRGVARFEGADHGSSVSFFVGAFEPGGGPPLHTHPYDETFVILEGTVTFEVDGETIDAAAGQILVVPAGAVHRFTATGDRPLRQVDVHPAPRMSQTNVE